MEYFQRLSLNLGRRAVRHDLFSTYVKFSVRLTFPYPLMRTRTGAYQGVGCASFSESYTRELNI